MNNGSTTMTASEREATRRRLQIWQEAQPLLEEQRWRELMALPEEKQLKMAGTLLSQRGNLPASRDTSGLLEQQASFQRSRCR